MTAHFRPCVKFRLLRVSLLFPTHLSRLYRCVSMTSVPLKEESVFGKLADGDENQNQRQTMFRRLDEARVRNAREVRRWTPSSRLELSTTIYFDFGSLNTPPPSRTFRPIRLPSLDQRGSIFHIPTLIDTHRLGPSACMMQTEMELVPDRNS